MTGRTIAITGTASGIGAATKARLEAGGDRVIGVDLAHADVEADLATAEGRTRAIDGVLHACGGTLDGFIPCAGVTGTGGPLLVRVNYYGTMALIEGLRPALEAGTDSSVVVISSNSTTMLPGLTRDDAMVFLEGTEDAAVAHFESRGYLAYPAGKLALAYWVRSNAPAWIASGVRVNAVAPGVTRTAMTEAAAADPETKAGLDQIPIPIDRWAEPDELAAAIAFMQSPDASYIVGQVLFVDGGIDALLQPFAHPAPLPGPQHA